MAYKIIASQCSGCFACETECPSGAIREKAGMPIINPEKCTECVDLGSPTCISVCPVAGTIVIDKSYPRP